MKIRKLFVIVTMTVGILSAQSLKMAVPDPVKAKRCLEEGRRLEAKAAPEGPGNQRLFEKALVKYLCAAHAGSAEGAMAAVNLSQSGMAPELSIDSIRLLAKIAAEGGVSSGYAALAESYCEGLQNCQNASKAISILFDGNAACSCHKFSYGIGDIMLIAAKTMEDTAHAYACYKQSPSKGTQKKLNSIISLNPSIDTTLSCEPIK